MRLSVSLAAAFLLASSTVSAKSLSFFGSDQRPLSDDLLIPGDNPLEYCNAEHGSDLLIIDHVNLSPNPPVPGQKLTIEAVGEFLEDIDEGAYVNLQVKYGLITLVKTQADLCEQVKNVDLDCPIKKGKTTITKDVDIPNEIPPGKYTVLADVYTQKDEKIICLTATVSFTRG